MHGWASAAEDLLPAEPAVVGAGMATLFVDARGHGRSDAAEFMSMPRFAENLEAAIAWLPSPLLAGFGTREPGAVAAGDGPTALRRVGIP